MLARSAYCHTAPYGLVCYTSGSGCAHATSRSTSRRIITSKRASAEDYAFLKCPVVLCSAVERSYPWPVRSICARRWRALPRDRRTPQVRLSADRSLPSQVVAQVRMPVNVSFVLDRSGSMKGDKMDRVRRATAPRDGAARCPGYRLGGDLRPSQRGAHSGRPGRQPARGCKSKIGRIRDAGGTKIAPAVEKGLREIDKGGPQMPFSRLVLLTDGQTENENDCLRQADDAGRRGVPITALGVGKDWNEDLLIEMANRSSGTADYIDQPGQDRGLFPEHRAARPGHRHPERGSDAAAGARHHATRGLAGDPADQQPGLPAGLRSRCERAAGRA